jgi:signal transduction histidine kinase/ligand-binding sensor domain-containing protein
MSSDRRTPKHASLMLCWMLSLLIFGPPTAAALNPAVVISQYAHTAWRFQDGAFQGTPNAITQTADGYLWIGTSAGLFRFDGVRFVRVPLQGVPATVTPGVLALLGAKDGSLWVGARQTLLQWKDGSWRRTLPLLGRVNAITEAPDGTIWIAQSRTNDREGGLCEVLGSGIRCYGQSLGVTNANAVSSEPDGSVLVGAPAGLMEWKDGHGKMLVPRGLGPAVDLQGITAILPEKDGSSLIGMVTVGAGLGLQRLSKEAMWSPFITALFDGTAVSVTSLRRDRDNSLWVGTQGDGIYRIHDGHVSHYKREDGLSSNGIVNSLEDHEGNVWFITSLGLDRFRDFKVVTYSDAEGLAGSAVSAVLASRDGTIWVPSAAGLNFIRADGVHLLTRADGLPGKKVTTLFEDSEGRLWIGVDDKLAIYSDGRFRVINHPDGSPLGTVQTIAEDNNHDIWVQQVTNRGSVVRVDSSLIATDIPFKSRVIGLASDSAGGVWVTVFHEAVSHYKDGKTEELMNSSTGRAIALQYIVSDPSGGFVSPTPTGFSRWEAGAYKSFGSENGLPCTTIFSLLMRKSGSLWAYTECGVVEVTRSQLDEWWHNPKVRLTLRLLDARDGAVPSAPSFTPKSSESPDGRLWFANGTTLQMVDPIHLRTNLLPPPVHIEELVADRKTYPVDRDLKLPKLTGDLEISYAALSLVSSEQVRFRYSLDNFDKDWQDAGVRRQAFYTNLRPGKYVFHVVACNNDGVWNTIGASIPFSIAPAYYQTISFKLLCAMLSLFAAWVLFRLRLQQATQTARERLAGQVAERERIARELHDTFLQGLYAVLLRFQTISDKVTENPAIQEMMADALNRADAVLVQGRESLRNLRGDPSSMTSVTEDLECFAKSCSIESEAQFSLTTTGQPRTFHPVIRDEVIQIAREAILNSFRHSGASAIHVELCYARTFFSLSVGDDGRGIDPLILAAGGKAGHWGMLGMRERCRKIGAQFTISSPSRRGTEVKLRIPSKLAYSSTPGFISWSKNLVSRISSDSVGPDASL